MSTVVKFRNNKSGYNSDNLNPEKLKYVRFHEDTQSSKAVLKIEKKLLTELNNIMKYFSDNYVAKGIDSYNYRNVYEEFRSDMEIQTFNIIRSYVTKTYTLATEYVADSLSVSGFLTKSDIDVIDEISNSYTERFFGRIRNVLESGIEKFEKTLTDIFIPASFNRDNKSIDENDEQLNVLVKSIERTESYLFSSLAILIINSTINKATILKTRKIILGDGTLNKNPVFQAAEFSDAELDEMLQDFGMKKYDRVRGGNVFYIWKTAQDDRVCDEYCLPLADQAFSILDSFIPEPEGDTHLNCRCRLLLLYI